jgi:CRP/FNR family transcriptional regulator, cyclic AMP receptor protein
MQMENARIDVRGLPVWERPAVVREAFDRLPDGVGLTIVTENEPRGLIARLGQRGRPDVTCEPRRIGTREWHVTLRRIAVSEDHLTAAGILRRCAIFADLNANEREILAADAALVSIRRGQTVFAANSEWPYIGVAAEGLLALSTDGDDRRHRIFYEIFPYEIFGEMEAFDDALSYGRVAALSKTARFLRLSRNAVLETGRRYPDVLTALARVATQRARLVMEALAAQPTMPIVARVARVLLPYAMPEKGLSAAAIPLPHMTQAQIAAAAGTVKEVAARAISELEQEGFLRRERGHIRYLDRQRLLDLIRQEGM